MINLLFSLWIGTSAQARLVDHIVAIVNDQIITASDAENFKKKLSSGGLVDDSLLQIYDAKKLLADRDSLLNFLIDEKLMDSEVKKKSLDVTVERVESEISDLTKKRGITRAQLADVLKERGVTMSQYQDYIKSSLERHSLIEKEVSSKIRISDEDIASYYLSKMGGRSKDQVYEYSLAQIEVMSKKGHDTDARQKIHDAFDELKAGQSFDTVAERYSEDPNFSNGGMLGTFDSGEMKSEVENAVKRLQSGEYSGIVKTKTGYNIFKVIKKSLIADPKMEAEKDQIRNTLFAEAFKRQFENWLKERREEAFVKINGWS